MGRVTSFLASVCLKGWTEQRQETVLMHPDLKFTGFSQAWGETDFPTPLCRCLWTACSATLARRPSWPPSSWSSATWRPPRPSPSSGKDYVTWVILTFWVNWFDSLKTQAREGGQAQRRLPAAARSARRRAQEAEVQEALRWGKKMFGKCATTWIVPPRAVFKSWGPTQGLKLKVPLRDPSFLCMFHLGPAYTHAMKLGKFNLDTMTNLITELTWK